MTKFENLVIQKFEEMDKRFDRIDDRFDSIDMRLDGMDKRFDGMDKRFDRMELRLEKCESEMSALKVGQNEMRKDIRRLEKKIDDTYELALDAWGQGYENRKLILEA